jgi:hypothetical protein
MAYADGPAVGLQTSVSGISGWFVTRAVIGLSARDRTSAKEAPEMIAET